MNKSKIAIAVSQVIEKIEMIAGMGWFLFFMLGVIIIITDGQKDGAAVIIIIFIIGALGLPVFFAGRKRKKMRLEFKKYVAQLSVDPTGSLENIAGARGTSVDVVKSNLQYMIKKHFFTDAYIDEKNNQLVLASMAQRAQQEQQMQQQSMRSGGSAQQIQYVTCNCPNCGGINKIAKGTVAECDFCGSPLNG